MLQMRGFDAVKEPHSNSGIPATQIPLLDSRACIACGLMTLNPQRLCFSCEPDFRAGDILTVVAGAVDRIVERLAPDDLDNRKRVAELFAHTAAAAAPEASAQ